MTAGGEASPTSPPPGTRSLGHTWPSTNQSASLKGDAPSGAVTFHEPAPPAQCQGSGFRAVYFTVPFDSAPRSLRLARPSQLRGGLSHSLSGEGAVVTISQRLGQVREGGGLAREAGSCSKFFLSGGNTGLSAPEALAGNLSFISVTSKDSFSQALVHGVHDGESLRGTQVVPNCTCRNYHPQPIGRKSVGATPGLVVDRGVQGRFA